MDKESLQQFLVSRQGAHGGEAALVSGGALEPADSQLALLGAKGEDLGSLQPQAWQGAGDPLRIERLEVPGGDGGDHHPAAGGVAEPTAISKANLAAPGRGTASHRACPFIGGSSGLPPLR